MLNGVFERLEVELDGRVGKITLLLDFELDLLVEGLGGQHHVLHHDLAGLLVRKNSAVVENVRAVMGQNIEDVRAAGETR